MPSMLLGTLEIEGFGTVMLDSGIWADFDMENWEWMTEVKMADGTSQGRVLML